MRKPHGHRSQNQHDDTLRQKVLRTAEQVDHPAHYGGADNPYETIKVLRAWLTPEEFRGFLKGNVIKYLSRAAAKGATQVDHEKAAWYADYLASYTKNPTT